MNPIQDVILHVYKLETEPSQRQQQQQQSSAGIRALSFVSRLLPSVGMGAYHTSLEIMDDRYTFAANAGVVKTRSNREGVPGNAQFQESIPLGACNLRNRGELNEIVQRLASSTFTSTAYHLVHRNCNHFTETLATALILHDQLAEANAPKRLKTYPEWINRLANTGKMVVSHDADIVPCDVFKEARYAVGTDTKVAWEFGSGKDQQKSKRNSSGKKELTEQQKAALAKIRGSTAKK